MTRTLPHSAEIEAALLGCVLLVPATYGTTKGTVRAEDFYSPANGVAWTAIEAITRRGERVDPVTLRAEVVRMGKLEAVGGDAYLLGLADVAIDPEAASQYARTIRDHARHRALIQVCSTLAARGYSPDLTWTEYRAECERAIRDVTTAEADGEPKHISDVLAEVVTHAEETCRRGLGSVTGAKSGIRSLDLHIGGWQPGRLYVVGGRPGMGKSAFTSATILASTAEDPCLVFSLEMPSLENGQRLLAAEIGMDLRDLAQSKIARHEWDGIARTCARLHHLPIFVDDTTRTLDQIVAKSRRMRAKHGRIGPIILDYLQLIRGDRKLQREQQISETTRELKSLSKELECPVIVLSQLNRECEKRPDKRPQLSDLRESGAIEQDADGIVFVYRRGYYAAQLAKAGGKRGKWEPETDIAPGEDDGITEFIVAKMRGGPTGTVKALFEPTSARFVDIQSNDYGDRGGFGDA